MPTKSNFTDGTKLTASDANTYLTNCGLDFISETTATSGASMSVSGCFSSTYDSYRVQVLNCRTVAGAGSSLYMRLRDSGGDISTSAYYMATNDSVYNLTTPTSYTSGGAINSFAYGNGLTGLIDEGWFFGSSGVCINMEVISPNRSSRTGWIAHGADLNFTVGAFIDTGGSTFSSGFFDGANQCTGMTFYVVSTTFANIRVRVYGYRKQ